METRYCLYCAKEYVPRIPLYPQKTCSFECFRVLYSRGVGFWGHPNGCIYFIQCGGSGGPIKIGVSGEVPPTKRLKSLQGGNPYRLILLGYIPHLESDLVERWIHSHFREYRLIGEWFRPGEGLLRFIREAKLDR